MGVLIQAIPRRLYDSFLSSLWRFHLEECGASDSASGLNCGVGEYCDSLYSVKSSAAPKAFAF